MDYYVVQVSTGKEKNFIEDAEFKNKFDELSYSIVFPQRILKIRKAGKVTEKQLPVFAGYLFIGTDKISKELYQHLKRCKGFYRFLPNNQEPRFLEGRDLEILNQFISFGGLAKISQVVFDENDRNLGEIIDILTPGANDVWVIKGEEGKEILIPYIEDVVKQIDIINKKVNIEVMEGLID